INALVAATEVLVPVQCEGGFHVDALTGIEDLIKRVRRINPELEISTLVGTMFDMKTKLSSDVYGDVLKKYGDKVCRNKIPRSVRLAEAVSHGQPINVYDPASKGAIAYRHVAKEVAGGATPRSR
ncbi:MAG: ParA family protein, partial [Acidimicrobiia bacterium]